jgi:hypothetical protein
VIQVHPTFRPAALFFTALALLAASLPARAVTFDFRQNLPTYDQGGSTIRQDNPTLNQGLIGTYTPGQIASGNDLRAVFSFSLDGLSQGMTVTNVQLSLGTNADSSSESGVFTLQLFQLTSTFLESGVTWNSRDGTNNWSTPGGDFSSTLLSSVTANPTANNSLVFVSTPQFVSAVQSSVDSNTPFYFILKLDGAGESGNSRRIFSVNSDDAASPAARPTLSVTAVPEPSSAILMLGGALTGLAGWRRRRAPRA